MQGVQLAHTIPSSRQKLGPRRSFPAYNQPEYHMFVASVFVQVYVSHRVIVRQLSGCPGKLGQAPERSLHRGPAVVLGRRMARSDTAARPKGAQNCEVGNACIFARNRAGPQEVDYLPPRPCKWPMIYPRPFPIVSDRTQTTQNSPGFSIV